MYLFPKIMVNCFCQWDDSVPWHVIFDQIYRSISSSKFIVLPLTSLKMWCPPKSLEHKPLKTKLWEHGPHVLQWSHVFMEIWILYTWHQSLNSLFQNMCMEWFLSLLFKAYKWKWKPLWERGHFYLHADGKLHQVWSKLILSLLYSLVISHFSTWLWQLREK